MAPVRAIIFSRDRAMQLDAALRSLQAHCRDAGDLAIKVLYRATSDQHADQYIELINEYRACSNIHFQRQGRFWLEIIEWLATSAESTPSGKRYVSIAHLGWRFALLRRSYYHSIQPGYIFFMVDDNLFVRDFDLQAAIRVLEDHAEILGFSLRLGMNTVYCYTMDQDQLLPEFSWLGPESLSYDWTRAQLDFGYPLEVSSSIYRVGDLLSYLDGVPFGNPNELEIALANLAPQIRFRPRLACLVQSAAFCVPINKVTERYKNRAGLFYPTSIGELARKFSEGYRIDVEAYSGYLPKGCHEEVDLKFVRRPGVSCG